MSLLFRGIDKKMIFEQQFSLSFTENDWNRRLELLERFLQ